jgi:hypothetical protein
MIIFKDVVTHQQETAMTETNQEAYLETIADGKGRMLVHNKHGQIGWAFYSKFFGDIIIDAAQRKRIISQETAATLRQELRQTNLPQNKTKEDRESIRRPDAKPI